MGNFHSSLQSTHNTHAAYAVTVVSITAYANCDPYAVPSTAYEKPTFKALTLAESFMWIFCGSFLHHYQL